MTKYDSHRERAGLRQKVISRAGRDIGEISPVRNAKRREECERSFLSFCNAYFSQTFFIPWSEDHIRVLAKAERAVLFGDLFAMAMPRGSGKTSIVVAACLWALLTGEHEFIALIGADESAASELLESIKTELETNPLLLEDFPEACFPIACLEGIPQRRLLYKGEPVRMEFTAKAIVLPNIPGSPSSEGVVRTSGITGRIRGMNYKRGDGRSIRPSLVIIDDPQTDESAGSTSQCATREKVLCGAILGLAGPGKKISGIMPCTVIRTGDMADRILDSGKYPQWNGERTKMVRSWPDNKDLLGEYVDLRAECQRRGDGSEVFNNFWREHQSELEAGAVISWKDRKGDYDVSAIQHAINLRMDIGEAAFQAEYQNEPLDEQASTTLLSADAICSKANGYDKFLIPSDATHLTAFIDVQGKLLYYVVVAWRGDFTGYVVDYGAWPKQKRSYYSLSDAMPTISDICPGGLEASIYGALGNLVNQLCGDEWTRDGGGVTKIARCLIDANWGESRNTVYSFCRQSQHSAVLLPTHGKGIKASGSPIHLWPVQTGEKRGLNWVIRRSQKSPIPYGIYDTNFWKSFVHARLLIPMGDSGCLSLYKAQAEHHRMLADHLHAEYPTAVEVSGGGRKTSEWQQRANHPDNHWFDGLVGCCVGASILGAQLENHEQKKPKPRVSLQQMAQQARGK